MALLTPLDVTRRIAALLGFFALVLLALILFWRVFLHHNQADPYEREQAVTVQVDRPSSRIVKITTHLS